MRFSSSPTLTRVLFASAALGILTFTQPLGAQGAQTAIDEAQLEQALRSAPTQRVSMSRAGSFQLNAHRELTPTESSCSRLINRAHYLQDLLQQQRSAAHFDNCAFDEGLAYIQTLIASADEAFFALTDSKTKPLDSAEFREGLTSVGQILHALQDFYAHSTYIEIQEQLDSGPDDGRRIPIVRVWEASAPEAIVSLKQQGLVSGTWGLGLPKHCTSGANGHGTLNKDSNSSPAGGRRIARWKMTLHQAALATARRATDDFLRFAGGRWKVIREGCGEEFEPLSLNDARALE